MPVGVVGVGLGYVGQIELAACAGVPDAAVLGGFDVDPEARAAFESAVGAPAYESLDALLADHADAAEAAIVASPHTLHYEHATRCLDAGLAVFVEKPMVTDLADAVALVDQADRAGRLLAVGYQRRHHPGYRALRAVIDWGRIGAVHAANCHLQQDWLAHGGWRLDPSLSGGGQLYDSGSHLLDALLWTTGTRPVSVAATVDERGQAPGVDVDSALALRLDREGAPATASVLVTGEGTAYPDTAESIAVWGTAGHAVLADDELLVVEAPEPGTTTREVTSYAVPDFETVTAQKVEHFLAALRGEVSVAATGREALDVVALTEATYEAASAGRTVDVRAAVDAASGATEGVPDDRQP